MTNRFCLRLYKDFSPRQWNAFCRDFDQSLKHLDVGYVETSEGCKISNLTDIFDATDCCFLIQFRCPENDAVSFSLPTENLEWDSTCTEITVKDGSAGFNFVMGLLVLLLNDYLGDMFHVTSELSYDDFFKPGSYLATTLKRDIKLPLDIDATYSIEQMGRPVPYVFQPGSSTVESYPRSKSKILQQLINTSFDLYF